MNFIWLFGSLANANSIDTFGFGSRSMSRGMGGVALNLGVESHSINPAAATGPFQSLFGIVSVRSQFSDLPAVAWDTNQDGLITEADSPLAPNAHAPSVDLFVLGAHAPITKRIHVGINCIVPTNRYFRVTSYEPSLPVWVMYRNRAERFDIRIGAGAKVWRGLHFGWGGMIGYAADLQLTGTLNVTSGQSEADPESSTMAVDLDIHEMEMAFNPRFVPSLSAFWDLGQLHPSLTGVSLGMNYRFESSKPLKAELDFQVNAAIEDVGDLSPMAMAVLAPFQLNIHDQFIPAQLSFGAAWKNDAMSINGDLRYVRWSSMHLHVIELNSHGLTTPMMDLDLTLQDGNAHQLLLKDTLSWSFGMNSKLPLSWEKWGVDTSFGLAYTPHTLDEIGDNISPLDANRITYAAGMRASRQFSGIQKRVSLSIFGQAHQLLSAVLQVNYDSPQTPGAPIGTNQIPMSGFMGSVGAQLTFGDL